MKSISGLVFPIVLMLTGCAGSMTGLDGQGVLLQGTGRDFLCILVGRLCQCRAE